jgi:hypothetical protein
MKKQFAVLVFLSLASLASAQRIDELNGKHTQMYPTKDKADKDAGDGKAKPGGGGQNLINHGGPVIANAQTVAIFWGPTWTSDSNLNAQANELINFFAAFGGTPEYKTVSQYGALPTSMSNRSWFDSSAPPTNVTDAAIQAEVVRYFNNAHGAVVETNTVYEVFLPPTSYSSFGSSTSCGGPHLVYCAYHSNFTYSASGPAMDIKYASLPYASCGGCQWTGFTAAQNLEHFACHETRETATDADGTAWYDSKGNEADDKCAWSPAPFIGTGGFAYQWEWSNANSACVKTK